MKLSFILAFVLSSATAFAAPAAAAPAAPPALRVGDVVLTLASAPKDSPLGLREYIPAGESIDHWTRMASVRVFKNEKNPVSYLMRLGGVVRKSHPAARALLYQPDNTREFVLDFLTFSNRPYIAEWNLMRARYDEKVGLVVCQYAVRFYNNREWDSATIIDLRKRMTAPFLAASFQEAPASEPPPAPLTRRHPSLMTGSVLPRGLH